MLDLKLGRAHHFHYGGVKTKRGGGVSESCLCIINRGQIEESLLSLLELILQLCLLKVSK